MIPRIGTLLHGFCDGYFGSDSYECKRIEGIGADWIAAREIDSGYVKLSTMPAEAALQIWMTPNTSAGCECK